MEEEKDFGRILVKPLSYWRERNRQKCIERDAFYGQKVEEDR